MALAGLAAISLAAVPPAQAGLLGGPSDNDIYSSDTVSAVVRPAARARASSISATKATCSLHCRQQHGSTAGSTGQQLGQGPCRASYTSGWLPAAWFAAAAVVEPTGCCTTPSSSLAPCWVRCIMLGSAVQCCACTAHATHAGVLVALQALECCQLYRQSLPWPCPALELEHRLHNAQGMNPVC